MADYFSNTITWNLPYGSFSPSQLMEFVGELPLWHPSHLRNIIGWRFLLTNQSWRVWLLIVLWEYIGVVPQSTAASTATTWRILKRIQMIVSQTQFVIVTVMMSPPGVWIKKEKAPEARSKDFVIQQRVPFLKNSPK